MLLYIGRSDLERSSYFRLEESKAQIDSSLTGPKFSVVGSGDLDFLVAGNTGRNKEIYVNFNRKTCFA